MKIPFIELCRPDTLFECVPAVVWDIVPLNGWLHAAIVASIPRESVWWEHSLEPLSQFPTLPHLGDLHLPIDHPDRIPRIEDLIQLPSVPAVMPCAPRCAGSATPSLSLPARSRGKMVLVFQHAEETSLRSLGFKPFDCILFHLHHLDYYCSIILT